MYHATGTYYGYHGIGSTPRQTLSSPGNMPYMTESPNTRVWQEAANALNTAEGFGLTPLLEDGILGPATCARALELGVPSPSQCIGGGAPPPAVGPAPTPGRAPTPGAAATLPGVTEAGMGGGTNWIVIGGGIALVVVGVAVAMRKGQRK